MKPLVLKDIVLKYYGKTALKINEFCAEDSFALVGCSGSGKSNFLKVIAGLEEIESGYIYTFGTECGDKKPKYREISLISAHTPLFNNKSAYYNLAYPLIKRKFSKGEIDKKVKELLKWFKSLGVCDIFNIGEKYLSDDSVDLKDKEDICSNYTPQSAVKIDLNQKVKDLSTTQRTALIFARAMIKNPQILLLDEPGEIIGDMPLFLNLLKQSKCFFIFATYDFDLAAKVINHFVILRNGNIIFDGDMQSLKNTNDNYIKKMCFLV